MNGIGILLAFWWAYFGWRGNILCSVLLPIFILLYQDCGRTIPSSPRVLLHFYVCTCTWAWSFNGLHALGILANFRVFFFTELLVQCDGCLGWRWVWWAGLVAGLWVEQACGVFLLPGFGVRSSSPQVPGHPTCMSNSDVNKVLPNQ